MEKYITKYKTKREQQSSPRLLEIQKVAAKPSDTRILEDWSKKKCATRRRICKMVSLPFSSQPIMLYYDIETGGFFKDSDILQVAITRGNNTAQEDLNVFALLTKLMDYR